MNNHKKHEKKYRDIEKAYDPKAPKERIDRTCLKCEREFVTSSKFVRLCNSCKLTVEYKDG